MTLRDMLSQATYDWWHEQRAIVLKFSEANGGKISFELFKKWASENIRVSEFLRRFDMLPTVEEER
jgi:hypothetical protein